MRRSATSAPITSSVIDCAISVIEVLPNACAVPQGLNTPRPAGTYYVEFSDATGQEVGVYNSPELCPGGHLVADGKPVLPDGILQLAEEAEAEVKQIKDNAVKNLPPLPIDPIYSQDASVIVQGYQTRSIPEMILDL